MTVYEHICQSTLSLSAFSALSTTRFLPRSFKFRTGRAQFPNSDFPSSCYVWECVCLFHFKLVEPPSYQAADIKISVAVNKMARAQFLTFLFFFFHPSPTRRPRFSCKLQLICAIIHRRARWVLLLQGGKSSLVSRSLEMCLQRAPQITSACIYGRRKNPLHSVRTDIGLTNCSRCEISSRRWIRGAALRCSWAVTDMKDSRTGENLCSFVISAG